MSRSTWACELKCINIHQSPLLQMSRSTWACELKYGCKVEWWNTFLSRSTWACELKSMVNSSLFYSLGHAPRERVSWNWQGMVIFLKCIVTLHVSVWVEILIKVNLSDIDRVTLHVSVWVEMTAHSLPPIQSLSRSTWACELKSFFTRFNSMSYRSRSTWACELKYDGTRRWPQQRSHAPRERVSWNYLLRFVLTAVLVTLHVSVWVEIPHTCNVVNDHHGHAPRERVSWNFYAVYKSLNHIVTLHVSVWVEILLVWWICTRPVVTLHVSVWVEIRWFSPLRASISVTLHVSVWVEIYVTGKKYAAFIVTLHVSVWVEMCSHSPLW